MINTTFRDKEVQVKERLSLGEASGFADYVVMNVTDIEDATYSPLFYNIATIQAFFLYYIEDIEKPSIQEVDDNFDEYQNFINDIFKDAKFKTDRYNNMIDDVDRMIRLNKDIIVQRQSNDVSKLVTELLQLQIENQKAQKKMIRDVEEMNKQYSKKEIMKITKALTGLAKNINLPEVQKGLVSEIVDIKESKENTSEED
jgi:hypothetical protein